MAATILRVGLTTPVGFTAATTAAAIRAGIARIRDHAFDPLNEPAVSLAWLDDEVLPPLDREVAPLDDRTARLVRLGSHALAEALIGTADPTALFLALPEAIEDTHHDGHILGALAQQAGVTLDRESSRVIRRGRAGGLLALEEALAYLGAGRAKRVCVGGIDSHFEVEVLRRLALAGRLVGEDSGDGFVPGEAAAFVLLGPPRGRGVRVCAAAHVGAASLREGTAQAVQALLRTTETPPIRHVYAGSTGENVWAREWSIARLRCAEHFAAEARLDHPAEFIGDVGAAVGPLLVGLATIAVIRGYRASPCLVWCGSDDGERAATLLAQMPEGTT